ncbi:MAG TPA: molybdopterin-dependent oxidoreductase [Vicinamibacterales bacterium]|nr:molybdopterin-dependent oxidoreductase [Vicinamibacterales bacterium]
MDRRSFIKLTAITGTSGALTACGNPENLLIRFIPEETLVPGIAQWRPSVCPLCRSGCGLQVKVMQADAEVMRNGQLGVIRMGAAKKLEGSPAHPISQGGLCPRGQAAIQVTYHPDRITQPLRRTGTRGQGRFEAVSWDDAIAELRSHLDTLAAEGNQGALAFLARPGHSHRQALIRQFLNGYGAPPPVVVDLFGDDVLRRANELSFGHAQLPTFDLARAGYVLSFGADFLGTWNSPVSQNAGYGAMRHGRPGVRGSFVQVEARMSQTGASADEWVPVRPGTEGVLALGLAHVILAEKLRSPEPAGRAGALLEGWADGLSAYAPDRVEQMTGVAARRIERLARAFAGQGPAVAMIAGPALAHTNGLFGALAVNALTALAGSVHQPGGLLFMPQLEIALAQDRPRALDALAADILAADRSPVQALLTDGADPVFGSPRAWRVREAFERIPFIASFGSFLDDTSTLADLILPDHSFLESWVDALPESGAPVAVASVAAPAMRPLHETRAMPDVLLEAARGLQQPVDPPLPWETFEAMLQSTFAALPPAVSDADTWTTVQGQGGWWGERPAPGVAAAAAAGTTSRTFGWTEPRFDGEEGEYPFHLLPYPSQAFLDGSLAHLPWLQEMPDPLTSAMWSSWVEINPATAGRLGIAQGDVIEIASRHGTLRAPALVSPGLAPDIVAVPAGQGHGTYTRYASGRGVNPIEILAPMAEAETGALAWAATRVRVTRVGNADGRLILFAGGLREHPDVHHR